MAPVNSDDYCVRTGQEARHGAFWRDALAELFATFLLVAAQIFLLQDWQTTPNPQALQVQVGLGMAFVVVAVGYGLGDYGGAHMNPAVTMALMIRAEISFLKALIYWIMQCAGAIGAAFFVYAITPAAKVGMLGNTFLVDLEWWQGLLIEMIITLTVCLAALGTQNIPRKGYIILPSLPVGFAIGLGLFIALPSTGGSMNPARSLGPAVAWNVMEGGGDVWNDHWVYWAGPMLGAVVAAILYWIFDRVDRAPSSHYYGNNTNANTSTWPYSNGKTSSSDALNSYQRGLHNHI